MDYDCDKEVPSRSKRCVRCVVDKKKCSLGAMAPSGLEDEAVDEEFAELPPSSPKSSGFLANIKNPFKRKTADRSPESAVPSESLRPVIHIPIGPPRKKSSTSSFGSQSIGEGSSVIDNRSIQSFYDSTSFVGGPARQGPYPAMSMGPPPSRSPSMMSTSTRYNPDDPEHRIQRLENMLRSSHDDLLLARDTIQFKDEQIRNLRFRQDQEREEYQRQISEMRRGQRPPPGGDGRRGN